MKEKRKKINEEITSENVQVITDNGENLGEMKLSDALAKAKEQNLDLLEMSQNKDKSIAKIIDYGKYLYRQKKQTQKQRAQGKSPDLKTIRITFKIGDHDLQVKRKQAEKFASGGHSLKISLMLR